MANAATLPTQVIRVTDPKTGARTSIPLSGATDAQKAAAGIVTATNTAPAVRNPATGAVLAYQNALKNGTNTAPGSTTTSQAQATAAAAVAASSKKKYMIVGGAILLIIIVVVILLSTKSKGNE